MKQEQGIQFRLRVLALMLMCTFFVLTVDAQHAVRQYQKETGDYASLYSGEMELVYNRRYYKEPPYYLSPEFVKGELLFKGKYYPEVLLRLDLYKDQLIVLLPDKQLGKQVDPLNLTWVRLHGKHFIYHHNPTGEGELKQGYYMLLHQDDSLSLLCRHIYQPNSLHDTAERTFSRSTRYYLGYRGMFHQVKNRSSVAQLFPAYKRAIKQFASREKLHFGRQQEQALTKLASKVGEWLMQEADRQEGVSPSTDKGGHVAEQHRQKAPSTQEIRNVLQQMELQTTFPAELSYRKEIGAESSRYQGTGKTEKATSENRVYTVGDAYARPIPQKATITGRVTDFKTGDPLVGIHLVMRDPWTAASTDEFGNYIITLPVGRVLLEISGVNIRDTRRQLILHSDGRLDIELEEEDYMMEEVTITSGRIDNVKHTQMGVEKLQMATIKNIPMALGEVDLLKTIQSLPGVKTVGEASGGFNVRGGATDQNLILLNDGTIYNPNHLFGFFTAFSSEMIDEAELYKSSIPAQYGGRISSVLDIKGKEANKEKFTGSAGIGLVTSKLTLEIPTVKEKASLLVSGRTTYSDWILKTLPRKSGYNEGKAGFYDLGLTYNHKLDDANLLSIYGYYSHDRFSFSKDEKYTYSNANASAKWRRVINEGLVGYFTTGYDHYNYANTDSKDKEYAYRLGFAINQVFIKADFTHRIGTHHKLDFGVKSMYYAINPGTYEPKGSLSNVTHDKLQNDNALETALYVGDNWEVTSRLSIDAGIRYSLFNSFGPKTYYRYQEGVLPDLSNVIDTVSVGRGGVTKSYHGPEFRLSGRYMLTDNLSVKAGFNSMRQYIHKLSNTTIMSPTDTWKLSDANIRPQTGWQVATGLYFDTPNGVWEFSAEGYYKRMKEYLDYRSGAQILMNHHLETDVISTRGHAYGVEVAIKKTTGRLNGWMSYTYSRTFLRQDDGRISSPVNGGEWYPTAYDKPHDLKLVGNYRFTRRYSLSVNVDYSTGRPVTVPAGQYYDYAEGTSQVYYTQRNSHRIPDYFRMDCSFNIEPSHKLTLLTHSSISIGVYNLTGRRNIYSVYYLPEEGKIKGYQMSIFGVPIPFVTYNIKF